jgi:acyl transferase domain-containing protein/acyl carrier protein
MSPVAVIGFSGRFPGGADTSEELWSALAAGRDLVGAVPRTRWDAERYFQPQLTAGLGHVTRSGGFIQDVDAFDPVAFGISPREAETMDPAQRLLLEAAWRCWEAAGLRPSDWARRPVGVFVGAFTQDYLLLQLGDRATTVATPHTATGTTQTLLSNRISYCYCLAGPSLTVDTACSSSLVALHLAAASLDRGESEIAFAAGAQLQLTPYHTALESRGGFLSPGGRCRAFDHRADGYVRAEAVGMVLLAPLARAVAENWPIAAVIRATGMNQNGRPIGITQPNEDAQRRLIAAALERAGLTADDIGYVEAHGTGTRAGDRAEIRALGDALGRRRRGGPLLVGSVKTNIGHAEAAAGIAGLIKVMLSLRHRIIPPHLHWEQAPPDIDLPELGLRLPLTCEPWPKAAPFAAINSFGFGGTNAHAVVGPPPARHRIRARRVRRASSSALPFVALLSGPSRDHLPLQARALAAFISGMPAAADLHEVCAGLMHQRDHLAHRLAVVGATRDALAASLDDFARRPVSPEWMQGERPTGAAPVLAFVFAGMGPQWRGMGQGLARAFPAVATVFSQCDSCFRALAGYSVLERVRAAPEAAPLPADLAQPLNLFLQLGLARLLESWGVRADTMVGHSVGEIAAFHLAGALDLDTAIALVFHRSRLQARLAGQGGMLAVRADAATIRPLLDRHGLSVAAVNAPSSVTVAGPRASLDAFAAAAAAASIYVRRLDVDVPYHSAMLAPLEREFRDSVGHLSFSKPAVPLYSTVTGELMEDAAATPFVDYWWRNLREPVAFASAISAMAARGLSIVQELSAHPVLSGYLHELLRDTSAAILPGLTRHGDDAAAAVECLARLYARGADPDWSALIPRPGRKVALPGFAWRRARFWSEAADKRALRLAEADNPLLGYRRPGPGWIWEVDLADRPAWRLADHVVMGRCRIPAAVFIEMLTAARALMAPASPGFITDLRFLGAVTLPEQGEIRLTTVAEARDGMVRIFLGESPVVEARFVTSLSAPSGTSAALPQIAWDRARRMSGAEYYAALKSLGFDYGPAFNRIARIEFDAEHRQAVIDGDLVERLDFPPAVLDGALQSMLAGEVLAHEADARQGRDRLPVAIDGVRLFRPLAAADFPLTATGVQVRRDDRETVGDLVLHASSGELLAELRGITLRAIARPSALVTGRTPADTLFTLAWRPPARARAGKRSRGPREWLVWARPGGAGARFAETLQAAGARVHCADPIQPGGAGWEILSDQTREPPLTVVDLQALDWTDGAASADLTRIAALTRHCAQVGRAARKGTEVWLATRNAQHDRSPVPAQAAVWGIGRTLINAEQGERWRGLVDFSGEGLEQGLAALPALIGSARYETQFRWADGGWLVPALERATVSAAPPLWLRSDATYLVTGAFGAIGGVSVQYLVDRGARNLILLGSAEIPNRASWDAPQPPAARDRIDLVRSLEARGIRAMAAGFDVRQPDGWQALLDRLARSGLPPIRGVVHAAGVAADRAVADATAAEVERAFGAKVIGIGTLLERIDASTLDFFLLHSSVAGLFPAYGQGAYAAANGYLDALARSLQTRGVPARSIAWGPWTVGMAADERLSRLFVKQGLLPIAPEEGYRLLETAFCAPTVPLYCAAIAWREFANAQRRQHWLFKDHIAAAGRLLPTMKPARRERFAGMTETARREAATADLIDFAAQVLRLDPSDLRPHDNLVRLGLDSLMAVELQIMIAADWGSEIAIADLLGRESLQGLAGRIVAATGSLPERGNVERKAKRASHDLPAVERV